MKRPPVHELRRCVGRVARTTAGAAVVVVVFAVASATAIVVSDDPAPVVIAFGALTVSALQFWRTEFRGPEVTVLVVDSPTMEISPPDSHGKTEYVLTVRQPIVVENTGGRPCALAKFRIENELIRVSGWGSERMTIEEGLGGPWGRPQPVVLSPREPRLFTAAWALTVKVKPLDGTPLNLGQRLRKSGLVKPVRHAELVYSESGTTVAKNVRIELNEDAIKEAAKQLVVLSEGGELGFPIEGPDQVYIDFSGVPDHPQSEESPPE